MPDHDVVIVGSGFNSLVCAAAHDGMDELAAFSGAARRPLSAWLETAFASPVSRALIAPWVLHAGLGPDAPASALLGKVILASLDAAGMRFVEGGWDKPVGAFTRIVEAGGGEVVTGAEVTAVEASAVAGFGS